MNVDGGMAVAPGYELAVSALGAVVWCLSRAHKDFALLSLGQFQVSVVVIVARVMVMCWWLLGL